MLINFSINLFNENSDKVTSFKENEFSINPFPKPKNNEIVAIEYFKNFIKKYECIFNEEKFSWDHNKDKKSIELSYFTYDNLMEYNMIISY